MAELSLDQIYTALQKASSAADADPSDTQAAADAKTLAQMYRDEQARQQASDQQDTQPPGRGGIYVQKNPFAEGLAKFQLDNTGRAAFQPVPHTGYRAQVNRTIDRDPSVGRPPRTMGQIGQDYANMLQGNLEGRVGSVAGAPGDLTQLSEGIFVPGAKLREEADKYRLFATTPEAENFMFGKAKTPEQSFGRFTGEFSGPGMVNKFLEAVTPAARVAETGARAFGRGMGRAFPVAAGSRDRNIAETVREKVPDIDQRVQQGGTPENIPGAPRTTYQQYGEGSQGLGELDAAARAQNKADFTTLGDKQKAAQSDALAKTVTGGSGADLASFTKSELAKIDERENAALEDARLNAEYQIERTGPKTETDEAGGKLRDFAQKAKDAARAVRQRLWSIIDPDGTLISNARPIMERVRGFRKELADVPETVPLSPAEERIYDLVDAYTPDMPFQRITALRAAVNDALRQEIDKQGVVYGRLSRVRGAIEDAINTQIEAKVANPDDDLTQQLISAFREDVEGTPSFGYGDFGRGEQGAKAAQGGAGGGGAAGAEAGAQGAEGGGLPTVQGAAGVPKAPVAPARRRSLFTTIAGLGGIKTKNAAGKLTPEGQRILAALGDGSRSIINEKTGVTAEEMLRKLKEEGWFGRVSEAEARTIETGKIPGDDLRDMEDLIDAQARGEKVYHPEDVPPGERYDPQRHEAFLSERARAAGVSDRGPRERLSTWDKRIRDAEEEQARAKAEQAAYEAPSQTNIDEGARQRLGEATDYERNYQDTFRTGSVKNILQPGARKDVYAQGASTVPKQIFKPGAGGGEAITAYRRAVGDPEAMKVIEEYAAQSLRDKAMKDGILDKRKYDKWMQDHGPALRAFPELQARFADAAKASERVGEVERAGAAARARFQTDAVKKILGKEGDPALTDEGVKNAINSIMGSPTRDQQIRQLVSLAEKDPIAMQGLRGAFRDHIYDKLVKNDGTIKGEAFRTYLRQNRGTLNRVFTDDEMTLMGKLADEIEVASREGVAGQALEGRSTLLKSIVYYLTRRATSQTIGAAATGAMGGAALGAHVGSVGGMVGAAAGAVILGVLEKLRARGITKESELFRDVMLNPDAMKALLERVPPGKSPQPSIDRLLKAMQSSGTKRRTATFVADKEQANKERRDNPRAPKNGFLDKLDTMLPAAP